MTLKLAECRVAVAGLGLIGASLCMDLTRRQLCREVRGISRSAATIARAIDLGVVDQGTTSLLTGVKGADIVVLAAPVRIAMRQLREIGPSLKQNAVVVDVGSTSAAVVQTMEALPPGIQPLATHPMAGKETSGFDAAEPALFANATWVLTPLARTSEAAVVLFAELVTAVGAHPVRMEALKHDRVVAAISHLPFLVSSALVQTVVAQGARDPEVWDLAAGGFRDTSRVAASEASMFLDILMTNKEHVGICLDQFIAHIQALRTLIEGDQEDRLVETLSHNRSARRSWHAQYEARRRPAI